MNGLLNDLPKQVATGIAGRGRPVHIVFGAPVELGSLLEAPGSPKTYKRIAETCLEVIGERGQEEKAIRERNGERLTGEAEGAMTRRSHVRREAQSPPRSPPKKTTKPRPEGREEGRAEAAGRPRRESAAPKRAAALQGQQAPSGPQIVHWEIQSQSPEKLHDFYAEVFGWEVDANNPMKYGMVASGGKDGINGGIGGSPVPGSRVLVYANVPDIDHALGRILSLGGKTVMPRTDLGMVIMAIYEDPEGNTMGIIEG